MKTKKSTVFSPIQPFALLIYSATIHSRGHVTCVWSKGAGFV